MQLSAARVLRLSLLLGVSVANAACAETTSSGAISVPVGADPMSEGKDKKPPAPPKASGSAPKERELAWIVPGPESMPLGAVKITYLNAAGEPKDRVEQSELRRFARGRYTELVLDVLHGDAPEPDRRRFLALHDVVYEIGDATCKAWRSARAPEQVAAGAPRAAEGLRPYAVEWSEGHTGPLAAFHGPFRARLIAENDVVQSRRADRYGVNLASADGETTGTVDVWVERERNLLVAARGEVLEPDRAPVQRPDGTEADAEPGTVQSFAAVLVAEDVPEEPELAPECKRAQVLP